MATWAGKPTRTGAVAVATTAASAMAPVTKTAVDVFFILAAVRRLPRLWTEPPYFVAYVGRSASVSTVIAPTGQARTARRARAAIDAVVAEDSRCA